MAKIQPLLLPAAASSSSSSSSSSSCHGRGGLPLGVEQQQRQRVYTVWMKSLVFNGNGCTVYGPDGGVAFRVDNYGSRGGREAVLMDRAGKALVRVRRKGLGVFSRWEACRCRDDGGAGDGLTEETTAKTPWFVARRAGKRGATVTLHGSGGASCCRVVDGQAGKPGYSVVGGRGEAVAEVARKQTAAGVALGEDVLSLTVRSPEVDQLLVLAVVVVRGLMNRAM